MNERSAAAMIVLAAVLWGTTGTARALAPTEASPVAVGAVRIAIGGAVLVVLALFRGSLRGRWALRPTLAAAVGVALYQVAFFEGVARAGVAVGTIVGIGSAPVFAGLIAAVVLRERPGARWLAATALAVVGVTLLARPQGAVPSEPLAVLLPLGAGLAYAVYATASKSLLRDHDNVAVAAVAFGVGAVLLIPVLIGADLSWVGRPAGMLVALELGLVATALAYVVFMAGLARLPVSWGATLSLAEPLTAAILGRVVLGEILSGEQLIGAGLVAAGLIALASAPAPS